MGWVNPPGGLLALRERPPARRDPLLASPTWRRAPSAPQLTLLRFTVGQAYVWRDGDELTLIDTGPAGSGPDDRGRARADWAGCAGSC